MANYDFSEFKTRQSEIERWFKDEIALLRTGRATPSLVEDIRVDYFGAKTPLKAVGSILVEDARTLRVKPWSADTAMQIEQAINSSELGIRAVIDKDTVRIVFPELTEERRRGLLKLLNDKLEEARISLRRKRDDIWRDVQDKEKDGDIGEDDKYRFKDQLQEMIEKANKKLEEISSAKEKEIEK